MITETPQDQPLAFAREFSQAVAFPLPIRGVRMRSEPGTDGAPETYWVTFAYERPDHTFNWMEVALPEAARAALSTTTLSGDDVITQLYQQAMGPVLDAFHHDWRDTWPSA